MTDGSSIFTSWFKLICGSQRSQLEFVLWWCGSRTLYLPCDCDYWVFWSTASHDINAVYFVANMQSILCHETHVMLLTFAW